MPCGAASQYGWVYARSFGRCTAIFCVTGWLFSSGVIGSREPPPIAAGLPGAGVNGVSIRTSVRSTALRFTANAVTSIIDPGVAAGVPDIASSHRPVHIPIASTSSCLFSATHGPRSSESTAASASSKAGTVAAGSVSRYAAVTRAMIFPTAAPPGTRFQVRSTPSKRSAVAGAPATISR